MKIIKITSLGCPSCIIMNKILKEVTNEYKIEIEELDYDFDEIGNYNIGNILPALIFYKGEEEVARLYGEHKKEELITIIKENEWKNY